VGRFGEKERINYQKAQRKPLTFDSIFESNADIPIQTIPFFLTHLTEFFSQLIRHSFAPNFSYKCDRIYRRSLKTQWWHPQIS